MKLPIILSAGSFFVAAGLASAQPAPDAGRGLQAVLSGAAEAPGPGDPDATGSATITVNLGQNRVCYSLQVLNAAPATAAHIHVGPVGAAPPNNIVVTLVPPVSGASSGCADVRRSLALALLKNPAGYYVNVHNAEFPFGALRGQLTK